MGKGRQGENTHGKKLGADLSRKDFLKLGGAGLAGAALLGTAGCGGGSGSGDLILSWGPDDAGRLPKLISQFNKQGKGFEVKYREMPSDTGQYLDKIRTQFQPAALRAACQHVPASPALSATLPPRPASHEDPYRERKGSTPMATLRNDFPTSDPRERAESGGRRPQRADKALQAPC